MRLMPLLVWCLFAGALNAQTKGSAVRYTLEDCIRIGLERNFDVRLTNANAENAAADLTAAFGGYLPSANLTAGYSRQLTNLKPQFSFVNGIPVQGDPLPNYYSLGANVNWTVFNGFSREAQYDVAKYNMDAIEHDIRTQRLLVAYQITRSYLNVLRTRQLIETQEESLTLSKALYDRVKALYDNGRAPITQLLSQETEVANQETALVRAMNDHEGAKIDLLVLMCTDPSAPSEFDPASMPADVRNTDVGAFRSQIGSEEQSVERAITSRPDVSSARSRMQAAEASITAARSGYFPTLTANGGYTWGNFEINKFDTQGRISAGLSLFVPIFDRFQTNRSIEQARLSQKQAGVEYDRLEQNIQQNVRRAYLQLGAAEKGLEIADRAITPARTSYEAMQERFNLGSSTLVEVQQSNYQLITARNNRVAAMYAWLDAKAFVEFATGLFTEP
jgi:outer membrane protein